MCTRFATGRSASPFFNSSVFPNNPPPLAHPSDHLDTMPEEMHTPLTPNLKTNLSQAVTTCQTLRQSLLCRACKRPYGNARPWRSRNCEHTFCAVCAAVARGRLGPAASRAVAERGGKCPVGGCNIPLRPADVVEDVGVRGVLDACRGLVRWAADSTKDCPPSPCAGSQDVFETDLRLGSGLVASQ